MTIRFIKEEGKRFALVPEDVYERMLDDLDDLDDIRAYDRAKAKPQEFVPAALVDRLIAGENRIRVWRDHRGLTAAELADRAGISRPYLSQLEHDERQASSGVLQKLAAALEVEMADLVVPLQPTEA